MNEHDTHRRFRLDLPRRVKTLPEGLGNRYSRSRVCDCCKAGSGVELQKPTHSMRQGAQVWLRCDLRIVSYAWLVDTDRDSAASTITDAFGHTVLVCWGLLPSPLSGEVPFSLLITSIQFVLGRPDLPVKLGTSHTSACCGMPWWSVCIRRPNQRSRLSLRVLSMVCCSLLLRCLSRRRLIYASWSSVNNFISISPTLLVSSCRMVILHRPAGPRITRIKLILSQKVVLRSTGTEGISVLSKTENMHRRSPVRPPTPGDRRAARNRILIKLYEISMRMLHAHVVNSIGW